MEALLSRNILVRRGRNNRILAKLIDSAVFEEDGETEKDSDDADIKLKKRSKPYYGSCFDFMLRDCEDRP